MSLKLIKSNNCQRKAADKVGNYNTNDNLNL